MEEVGKWEMGMDLKSSGGKYDLSGKCHW